VNISSAILLEKKVYDGITVETQKSSCKKIIIIGIKIESVNERSGNM